MAKPLLNVIKGGWVSSEKWVNFPSTVRARSPHDRDRLCELRVSKSDLIKGAGQRRRQPAYQFWSIIAGKEPPVPHMVENPSDGLTSLLDAHACFAGINRPCGEDDSGDGFVAYVLKPKAFFAYEFRAPLVYSTKECVPGDLVFLVFGRLDNPSADSAVQGVITHWDFVDADDRDEMMPVDFATRFKKRLW